MFKELKKFINDELKQLVRSYINSTLIRTIGIILSISINIYIAYILNLSDLGTYYLILGYISVITSISLFGLFHPLIKFSSIDNYNNNVERYSRVYFQTFSIVLISGLFITVAILIIINSMQKIEFIFESSKSVIMLMVLSILPSSLNTLNSYFLRGLQRFNSSAFFQDVSTPLGFGIILFIQTYFYKIQNFYLSNVVSSYLIATCTSLILGLLFIKFNLELEMSLEFSGIRFLFETSFPIFKISIYQVIHSNLFIIILSFFVSNDQIGLFGFTTRILKLLSFGLTSLNFVLAPKIAILYKNKDFEKIENLLRSSNLLLFLGTFPLFIVILLNVNLIINIFSFPMQNVTTLFILIGIGELINVGSGSVGLVLKMTEYENNYQDIVLLTLIINLALSLIFLPIFGIYGAAGIYMVDNLLRNFLFIKFVYDNLGFFQFL